MIDMHAEIVDSPDAIELKTKKPEITFDNVSFGYNYDDGYALENVSFTLEPGKVTALVGPSGGGKTTAMNLISRFYDPIEGSILIDGIDIRDVTLFSLRQNIALVSQDITIFDDSVRANIAYGVPDVTDAEVIKAAKAAAAHDFIKELPDTYETNLGENGVKLSGGQRQRISIARAILRDTPILLLDEATSSLDNESEKEIQKSLQRLQKGRTTLVIAHRLSTIENADKIITLDNGKISEQGSHDELIGDKGIYARMHGFGTV
jgi:ABC-type multidrug transport system fused ATPase/permease subunit